MPDLSSFRVLSFDCYGTMIDWETGILSQLRPWLAKAEKRVSDHEILEAFGMHESAEEARSPDTLYPTVLERVHGELAATWGLDRDEDAAAALGRSVGQWPAFSDSHDALVRLGERYRLVILSNVDRASFAKSSSLLDVRFDAVYTAEDVGSYKPDPRNFSHLIESEGDAGYGPSEILHVGQSLFHDHVPATEAGLATCWIQRPTRAGDHGAARAPEYVPDVDFHFSSLAELADAVEQ